MRRTTLPWVCFLLLTACIGGEPADPDDDDENGSESPDTGFFGLVLPCDDIFVPGRPTGDVLTDVRERMLCRMEDGNEAFIVTWTYRCGARNTDVHYAMSPGPSVYGWGVDDEESAWQSWDNSQPRDVCDGARAR